MADEGESGIVRTEADNMPAGAVQRVAAGETADRLRAGEFIPRYSRRLALRLSDLRLDFAGSLAAAFERERETGSLFNLVPVVFACGILVYFIAPAEPIGAVLFLSALATGLLAWRLETHGPAYYTLVALSIFLAGMSAAKIRTWATDTPVIAGQMTALVSGLVLNADSNSRGAPRYLIRPDRIAGLTDSALPRRLRLSSSSRKTRFRPGNRIEGKARIMPMTGPAYPGGYDFAFFARFERRGGTGFFYGAPRSAGEPASVSLADRMLIALNLFRNAVAARIHAGLGGEPGDVAVALITGDRSGIDEKTSESLRQSGLAHVLAISGLHMALVALTVIAAIRWLFAWLPAVALNRPVRKWAAGAGLAAATAYLVISGASVATQRAWIMIAVMLAALLADRRAVTIRNVAIAAMVILAFAPESLLEPGFQMSFAAAAALVAAYESWTKRPMRRLDGVNSRTWPMRLARLAPAYLGGIVFTSLVAGLATGIFAAWHFHRVAPLGLVANVLAMPVVTSIVMPMALLSALVMPYGLEKLPLAVLGWGIERMVAISDWVNGFNVTGVTGLQPVAFLFAGAVGLAVLTLLRSRLRLLGLLPLAMLPLLYGGSNVPDLLVSEDGRAVAIADRQGKLVLLYPRRNRFISDIWLRAWSDGTEGDRSAISSDCNRDFCAASLRTGQRLEVVYAPKLLKQSCLTADILVAPRLRWVNCHNRKPALVLKRGDFERHGSHAIRLVEGAAGGGNKPKIEVRTAVLDESRPWSRKLPPADEDRHAARINRKLAGADRPARRIQGNQ